MHPNKGAGARSVVLQSTRLLLNHTQNQKPQTLPNPKALTLTRGSASARAACVVDSFGLVVEELVAKRSQSGDERGVNARLCGCVCEGEMKGAFWGDLFGVGLRVAAATGGVCVRMNGVVRRSMGVSEI